MDANKKPLISCLCITNNRVFFLQKAIKFFQSQTYENRELLIVCLDTDLVTIDYVKENYSKEANIQLVIIKEALNLTLGEIRNESIKAACGKYFCVWDDDDYHHCDRLSRSMEAINISGKKGVVLSNVIIHHLSTGRFYISVPRFWEQTLLFNKEKLMEMNVGYAALNRGEDTALVRLIIKDLYLLKDPVLYVYTIHASNTCDSSHLQAHLKVAERLDDEQEGILVKLIGGNCSDPFVSSQILDSHQFMRNFPLASLPDLLPWGVKPFCTYPNPRKIVAGKSHIYE
jgi:glycosyltransferase involved in cell wall biosynthesis